MEKSAEVRKLLVSKRQAATTLNVSVRTLENLIARKELETIRIGKRRLVPMAVLERFARRDHSTRSVDPVTK
jgi:excisionase family DNA binding protein